VEDFIMGVVIVGYMPKVKRPVKEKGFLIGYYSSYEVRLNSKGFFLSNNGVFIKPIGKYILKDKTFKKG
jgi:hypothetical protein